MKRYAVPLGRLHDWTHPSPDRTAYTTGGSLDFDAHCQVWPSRGAMLTACRLSQTGVLGSRPWKPLVKEVLDAPR
jgi:hypothetical protein